MNRNDYPWVTRVYPIDGTKKFIGYPSTGILVLGHPNSSNHWIRDILCRLNIEFASSHIASGNNSICTFSEIKEKILINPNILNLQTSKIIFIYRDPRDVIVSSYLSRKSREVLHLPHHPPMIYKSLSEFLYCPKAGIERCIQFNLFFRKQLNNAYFIKYENLKIDTFIEIKKAIAFLKLDISDEAINESIEYCSFENMKSKELQLRKSAGLDYQNAETFKYRRGVVGGYTDYLTTEDIRYCNQLLEKYNYFENMNYA